MRALRWSLAMVVAGMILAPTPPSAGGGWWNFIDLDSSYLGIGERFTFRQQLAFPDSVAAAQARKEDYGAYLMRDINQRVLDRAMGKANPKRWWAPVDRMLRVGDVEILPSNGNFVNAAVRLSIPEIPTGNYYLMLCDAGCRNPLADVVPSPVVVSADALSAKTARELRRLSDSTGVQIMRLDRRVRRSSAQVRGLEDEIVQMHAQIAALRDRPASPEERSDALWPSYLVGLGGGLLIALLAMGARLAMRRKGNPVPKRETAIEDIPDDTRELTTIP